MPLLCRTSRVMIMRVRRTLREIETEKYGILKRTVIVSHGLLSSLDVRKRNRMPVPVLRILARVPQFAENSNTHPQNRGTGEMGRRRPRGSWNRPRSIGRAGRWIGIRKVDDVKRKTNHEAIGEPIVQEEHKVGNGTEHP